MTAISAPLYTSDLSEALKSLIDLKTSRDNTTFTPYKLAKAIGVDRSLIQRLLNGDVENPRIDTLIKITQFFVEDGFLLTLDDLMRWRSKVIDVQEQIVMNNELKTLPLFQMNNFNGERVGSVTVPVPKSSPGTIAILSDKNIKPIFNAGSLFIVDMMKKPENENLVMIRSSNNKELILRKYLHDKNKNIALQPLDLNEFDGSTEQYIEPKKIIGVVILINVKT